MKIKRFNRISDADPESLLINSKKLQLRELATCPKWQQRSTVAQIRVTQSDVVQRFGVGTC